jgi:hypothetical protein
LIPASLDLFWQGPFTAEEYQGNFNLVDTPVNASDWQTLDALELVDRSTARVTGRECPTAKAVITGL